jgi:serine phosphatase RsbU (regulator of sigma subunit)
MLCQSPEDLTNLGWVEPFAGLTLSHHALAASALSEGGDWAEAFAVSDRELAISIGDVCGHDAAASKIMRALRKEIRAAADVSPDPAAVMRAVNDHFYQRREATYATSIFGLLDVRRRNLVFASAGHPAPFMMARRRARFLGPAINDLPLGILPALEVTLHRVPIFAGALLVFYTDGIAEFDRDYMLGETCLHRAVRAAYRSPAVTSASVIADQLARVTRRTDDASILTLRMARSA